MRWLRRREQPPAEVPPVEPSAVIEAAQRLRELTLGLQQRTEALIEKADRAQPGGTQ